MNIGTKPRTIEKYQKVKKLVLEGVYLIDALKRYRMSSSTYARLKAREAQDAQKKESQAV